MKDMMSYKGYHGSVKYNDEDQIFYGKVEYIKALISYEGTDVSSLKEAFQEGIEDYLELCEETGKEPEKPFKGTFNVRTRSDLHREAVLYANKNNLTLNKIITLALENFFKS